MEAIANWIFDLLYLVGTILAVWPLIKTNREAAKRANTVGRLASRDTEEVIPQIKWSWTGVVFLVSSVVAKLVFLLISNYVNDESDSILFALIIACVVLLITVLVRCLFINRYWRSD